MVWVIIWYYISRQQAIDGEAVVYHAFMSQLLIACGIMSVAVSKFMKQIMEAVCWKALLQTGAPVQLRIG